MGNFEAPAKPGRNNTSTAIINKVRIICTPESLICRISPKGHFKKAKLLIAVLKSLFFY
jgi:hypothetical protein